MEQMPTIRIREADRTQTRGFSVINRPWTLAELVKLPDLAARIREEYVYIAETDTSWCHADEGSIWNFCQTNCLMPSRAHAIE